MGARFYDPAHGRWLNRDPLGPEGGVNLYAYSSNDPIGRVDPLGLVDTGYDSFGSLWDKVKDRANSLWNSVKDNASRLSNSAKDRAGRLWNSAKDRAGRLWNNIKGSATYAANRLWTNAKYVGSRIRDGVSYAANRLWTNAKHVGNELLNGLRDVERRARYMDARGTEYLAAIGEVTHGIAQYGLSKLLILPAAIGHLEVQDQAGAVGDALWVSGESLPPSYAPRWYLQGSGFALQLSSNVADDSINVMPFAQKQSMEHFNNAASYFNGTSYSQDLLSD